MWSDPNYWANEHAVCTCGPNTGHSVKAIAYCADADVARFAALAMGNFSDMLFYIRKCASNCAEANELLKRAEGGK